MSAWARLRLSLRQPALVPPSGFTLSPPFRIYRTGAAYATNFDPTTVKPSYSGTVYVNSGGSFTDSGGASWGAGSNNNDGTAKATPVRSLRLAVAMGNALGTAFRLVAAPGEYKLTNTQARSGQPTLNATYADSWTSTSPTSNMVLECVGGGVVKNILNLTMPSFVATSDANIYVSTYTVESPNLLIDKAFLDARGRPAHPRPVLAAAIADIANPWPEINAQWTAYPGYGARFLDTVNKKVYVRLADNRAPDSSVLHMASTTGTRIPTNASPQLYLDHYEMWGGGFSLSSTSGPGLVCAVDCAFCYVPGNGFGWSGNLKGAIYVVRSGASECNGDGLNWHGKSGGTDTTTDPDIYEISAWGEWNGWDGGGTNNGSTIHEYCRIIRVNGSYTNNADRSIHDINHGMSWNLGCVAGPSFNAAASPKSDWVSGVGDGGAEVTKMWLDGCSVLPGSTTNLYAYSTAALKYANMTIGNFALGGTAANITAYTP